MEMCVDNPRSGFADLFATHPSVESRIAALIQYAGGHDPGPLKLPGYFRYEDGEAAEESGELAPAEPAGSVPPAGGDKPFLPSQPPAELGGGPAPGSGEPGPWGPHRRG
jgi:heat shock protein HtpX